MPYTKIHLTRKINEKYFTSQISNFKWSKGKIKNDNDFYRSFIKVSSNANIEMTYNSLNGILAIVLPLDEMLVLDNDRNYNPVSRRDQIEDLIQSYIKRLITIELSGFQVSKLYMGINLSFIDNIGGYLNAINVITPKRISWFDKEELNSGLSFSNKNNRVMFNYGQSLSGVPMNNVLRIENQIENKTAIRTRQRFGENLVFQSIFNPTILNMSFDIFSRTLKTIIPYNENLYNFNVLFAFRDYLRNTRGMNNEDINQIIDYYRIIIRNNSIDQAFQDINFRYDSNKGKIILNELRNILVADRSHEFAEYIRDIHRTFEITVNKIRNQ